jgi:hypothetical protein
MYGNIFKQLALWHHFLSHPHFSTSLQLSLHYTLKQMVTSHFSLKITNHTKILKFLLILSNWRSNACHIYLQVVLLGFFWTSLKLFSPWIFSKWIPSIVPTLFSYRIRSHSTPNYMHPWNGPHFNHDQAFKWSLFQCNGESIVLTHKPHFMPLISQNFCNTFFPTLIWSCN